MLCRQMVQALDRKWYPNSRDNWDDELFRQRVLLSLKGATRVLDLGAGAGIVRQMDFRGQGVHVCGIDPDSRVLANPLLDTAKVAWAEKVPFEDQTFDVVFADNVLEHLEDPLAVMVEVSRLLKPGGRFLFKTPNKWHYMPVIAKLTPHAFHRFYNRLRGRESSDTFPTVYRANTRSRIADLAKQSGMKVCTLELVEGRPEYMRVSPVTYVLGFAYERLVNAFPVLAGLRVVLIGILAKPPEGRETGQTS